MRATTAWLFTAISTASQVTVSQAAGWSGPTLFGNSFGVAGRNASYDYVVIGGGTAGLTIATRLAEIPNTSVAVIEAGSFYQIDNGNGSVVPALAPAQDTSTDPSQGALPLIDWRFVSVPQAGANNRRFHYARGKTLGGSSARNYMAFMRGTRGSYERWADHVGDSSYSYDKLLPYFKKSVKLTPPDYSKRQKNGTVLFNASDFSSDGGPLHASWPNWASPLGTWVIRAMDLLGIAQNKNAFSSGDLNGVAWVVTTINPENEHRETSQTSFLDQAMIQDAPLKVYTHALAKRIIFDSNRTATGVVVETAGLTYTLTATKEVILSAGVFQSPQLLQVSGVGPRAVLEKLKIPVISDLPGVGANLEDHTIAAITYRVGVLTSSKSANDPVAAANAASSYLKNGTGPLTSPTGPLAFEKLPSEAKSGLSPATVASLAKYPADWPEVEYLVVDGIPTAPDPRDGFNYGTVAIGLIAADSRGSVTINSTNAADPPVIDLGYLTAQSDVEVFLAGFKRARQIWQQMGNVTVGAEYIPGPSVASDSDIINYIRGSLRPIFHASSTCAMGKSGDSMAVVDSKARVFGVQRLRVVDISTFPFLIPGHPQATIYMLAEKIAEDIRSSR